MDERVKIGRLDVNLTALEVRDGNEVRRLEPRAAAILRRLLEQPGHVVSRQALIASVWGHPHVSKDALAVAVHRLRQTLGQQGDDGPVETVPRRGYRLGTATHAADPEPLRRRQSRMAWAAMLGAAVAVTAMVTWNREAPLLAPDGPEATLLRAEALWNRREPYEARKALALAQAALATGEVDARAHALLGRFYGYKTVQWLGLGREEAAVRGRRHLDRAIELAPGDAAVLTAAASFALHTERNPERARRLAREALRAESDFVAAQQVLALAAAALGDAEVAIRTIVEAAANSPADAAVQWDRAFILFLGRHHEESLAALQTAVALSPRDPYWLEAFNLHALGLHAQAAEVWVEQMDRSNCPVELAKDVRATFKLLAAVEESCEAGLAFHRGLWSFYAGDVGAAREQFAAARDEDDIMFLWRALYPLPIVLPTGGEVRVGLRRKRM